MSIIVMSGCATGIGAATRKVLEAAGHQIVGIDIRDAEVIAAANEHGIAMVFTGVRHFRH